MQKRKFEQILRMLPYSMCAKLWVEWINKYNKAENTLSVYILHGTDNDQVQSLMDSFCT